MRFKGLPRSLAGTQICYLCAYPNPFSGELSLSWDERRNPFNLFSFRRFLARFTDAFARLIAAVTGPERRSVPIWPIG